MRKIYLFVSSLMYKCVEDYIKSFISYIPNIELIIYDTLVKYSFDTKTDNIYIFVQMIPMTKLDHKYPHLYIINTEQMSINPYNQIHHIFPSTRKTVKTILDTDIKLLDYSLANIACLNRPSKYIPYCVYPPEIYNYPKTHDVAYIHPQSNIRKRIRRQLKDANVPVTILKGFGQDRDEQLFRHKILINVHYSPAYNIFEEIRCNRCVFNKMIVITQASKHFDTNPLKKYMIECNLNEIVECTQKVLYNYEQVHQKLFQDFNLQEIDQMYQNYLTKTINQIRAYCCWQKNRMNYYKTYQMGFIIRRMTRPINYLFDITYNNSFYYSVNNYSHFHQHDTQLDSHSATSSHPNKHPQPFF